MTATLNPRLRFDSLVVGAANRLAVTAARTVAEQLGTVYNPLLIYARPGLGKTHLLMAIGHQAREVRSGATVEYLTFDDFTEAYHTAVSQGQGDAWRQPYVQADLLLLDDVQFLAGRRELQAELLRLVDALQRGNRQIVLTSDRPPSEIEQLDERLVRRFAGGLVVDIAPPDFETRLAILRRKAEERQSAFLSGVLEEVARGSIESVRELLGVFNRLVAMQAVSDEPLSAEVARRLVGLPPAGTIAAPAGVPPRERAHLAATAEDVAATADLHDEFSEFLSDLAATLEAQVDNWRTRLIDACERFEAQGVITQRLRVLIEADLTEANADVALAQFEADVERLDELRAEVARLVPELVDRPALRDPDALGQAEGVLAEARVRAAPLPGPDAGRTLEQLAETPANRMALHAVRAVAQEPGARYNPLVITGGDADERSHLLHGAGNALRAAGIERVACFTATEFSDGVVAALSHDAVGAWRGRMRQLDALLLDGVDALAGRERTQEELFVLFNQLMERGVPILFTAAVRPAALEGLEPRLRSRLEGGLVAELQAPAAAPAPATPTPARAAPRAPSGPGLSRAALLSPEKVVWEWPEPSDRLAEEWR